MFPLVLLQAKAVRIQEARVSDLAQQTFPLVLLQAKAVSAGNRL